MQSVSFIDNLHEMADPILVEKIRKYHQSEFVQWVI